MRFGSPTMKTISILLRSAYVDVKILAINDKTLTIGHVKKEKADTKKKTALSGMVTY